MNSFQFMRSARLILALQSRRGAESFLLKQLTVGIAGRLVFGF
jgi:hypothetical protein